MTYILIDLVGDTTGDKNIKMTGLLIVVLVSEEDHTQIKDNSQVECSIENETSCNSKTSTSNPGIVLSM